MTVSRLSPRMIWLLLMLSASAACKYTAASTTAPPTPLGGDTAAVPTSTTPASYTGDSTAASAAAASAEAAASITPVLDTATAAPMPITASQRIGAAAGEQVPAQGTLDKADLYKRILALVDSLKTPEDMEAQQVARVTGIRLMPDPKWKERMFRRTQVSGGWTYRLSVVPLAGYLTPRIEFMFFPDGSRDPMKSETHVCSYDANLLSDELISRGFSRADAFDQFKQWVFSKPDASGKLVIAPVISTYRMSTASSDTQQICVRSIEIDMGEP